MCIVMSLQPSLSEPLSQRDNKHSEAAHRKSKQHSSTIPAPPSHPPHCYKAYQLYTLYRGKNGKIMQVGTDHWLSPYTSAVDMSLGPHFT